MIAFIIAFRHPDSTKNYQHVVELLNATLLSLANQTSENYRVYIGCNVAPDYEFDTRKVRFCTIDCPLPKSRKEVLLDKGVKRAYAIQTANNEINPDYFFLLDADDLVSNDCVKYLHQQDLPKSTGGYWLEKGYLLDMNNRKVQEKYGFNRYCGSSLILSATTVTSKLFIESSGVENISTHEEFLEACDEYVLEQVLGDHIAVRSYMASLGRPLQKLLRPLTCWKINTGANESNTKIPFGSRNLNSAFFTRFSITTLQERQASMPERLVEKIRLLKSWIASSKTGSND
ncbi:glycosyltransferase family 2 protein [Paraglaciecola chathamensis]|uniref:Glycosyltransferase family 2 protein n=1 Tax=Paraglaciecola chathamensis TaxID=368405 RepID=A0ABS0W9D3_9ALTE|nr:glycosyltransferase family 2 protein [Paraglaciecola chathamensis]MBJ2134976.1 glycosyltransferase family 2 protein [Paraglaciecola chathamensis]